MYLFMSYLNLYIYDYIYIYYSLSIYLFPCEIQNGTFTVTIPTFLSCISQVTMAWAWTVAQVPK